MTSAAVSTTDTSHGATAFGGLARNLVGFRWSSESAKVQPLRLSSCGSAPNSLISVPGVSSPRDGHLRRGDPDSPGTAGAAEVDFEIQFAALVVNKDALAFSAGIHEWVVVCQ